MNLLIDTLEQTLLDPQCAMNWHRLHQVWQLFPQDTSHQYVLDRLLALNKLDERSDVLRFTFLRDVSGGYCFSELAVNRLMAIDPVNPDRLAGFAAYSWGHAVKNLTSKKEFVESLQRLKMPELMIKLSDCASALLPKSLNRRVPDVIERVAIVSPYLADMNHTPSAMIAQQSAVLAEQGINVQVFSCQELQINEVTRFSGTLNQVILAPLDVAYWQTVLPSGVRLTCSDDRFSLEARWQEMFMSVSIFDPDVILLCGFFSPFAAALFQRRPTVGLSVHTTPPLSPLDVWLCGDERECEDSIMPWHPNFVSAINYFHPYRVRRPVKSGTVARADLKIAKEAIVWISVGARLDAEIKEPWVSRIIELLIEQPKVVWMLVGCNVPLPLCANTRGNEQIKVLGYRKDVPDLLGLADIYVNPPRMGGGFSVVEAMAESLPVLSLSDSDGGHKIAEHAVSDLANYIDKLHQLTMSSQLRLELGSKLKKRFEDQFDVEKSGKGLVGALSVASEKARTRLQT